LAQHGLAIFTHEQVAGKGQRGRKWSSSRGDNISLSVIIKPASLAVAQQFQLSACAALATCVFFKKYALEDVSIKWPNDLYWKDRKAGGILIESVVRTGEKGTSAWEWAIIGIGININQTEFAPDLPNPVSMKQITGRQANTVDLAKELCEILDHYFRELITNGFESILSSYLSHFYKKDKSVRLKKDNRVFEATIKGISPEGKLIVQHGIEEQFDLGEIQWLI
jgi:BirA family biotin operon repressor/biotin-[acetyl-CoA-carboxylase] ligase